MLARPIPSTDSTKRSSFRASLRSVSLLSALIGHLLLAATGQVRRTVPYTSQSAEPLGNTSKYTPTGAVVIVPMA